MYLTLVNLNCVQKVYLAIFWDMTDQDGDKKLTLSEFISLPMGTVENQQAQDVDDDWVRERKKEFQEVIDANQDGIVTMEELEVGHVLSCLFEVSSTNIFRYSLSPGYKPDLFPESVCKSNL